MFSPAQVPLGTAQRLKTQQGKAGHSGFGGVGTPTSGSGIWGVNKTYLEKNWGRKPVNAFGTGGDREGGRAKGRSISHH